VKELAAPVEDGKGAGGSLLGKGIAERCVYPDSLWGGVVITVCSRCKQTISETFDKGPEKKVSHGICAGCLAILESEIRESAKATENGSESEATTLHAEDP
jgi:hypothetical protein